MKFHRQEKFAILSKNTHNNRPNVSILVIIFSKGGIPVGDKLSAEGGSLIDLTSGVGHEIGKSI